MNPLAPLNLSAIPLPSFESLDPAVLKIGIIAILLFLFILLFAYARHHLLSVSMHGLRSGLIAGVFLVLLIEGATYYIYKNYVVGDKVSTLPQNLQIVVSDSTKSAKKVLGVKTEQKKPTAKELVTEYKTLDSDEADLVRNTVCKDTK